MQGNNNIGRGAEYLLSGATLLLHRKLRIFVLVPILVNTIIFAIMTIYLVMVFGEATMWITSFLPDWLNFLAWVITGVVGMFVMLTYGYSFSIITNIIAAPFYGVLAEKVEELVTGEKVDSEPLSQMIPRTLLREFGKLWYFVSRGLLVMIVLFFLSFVPLLNFICPALAFLWASWTIAVQYVDYSADNHKVSFKDIRPKLWGKKYSTHGLGMLGTLGSMIPIVNIFVLPAAVCAGTLFWLNELRDSPLQRLPNFKDLKSKDLESKGLVSKDS